MTQYIEGRALEFLILEVQEGKFLRADGECLCPVCNKEYRQHLKWKEAPTFHLLCNGRIIKT